MNDVLFIGIIVLFIVTYFHNKCKLYENMTGASDCQQSINDFNNALQLQQQQDKDNYAKEYAAWSSQKQGLVNTFQTSPSMWTSGAGICSGSKCEPVSSFFQVHENGNLSGWGKEQSSADWETCLRKCKDRTDCQWVNWSNNNTCFINSLNNRQGTEHGFKTANGYARYSNQNIDGYTNGLPNARMGSADQCQAFCDQNPGCKHWQYDQGTCWLQHVGNQNGWRVGVKMPRSNIAFSDADPYITQQIGNAPVLRHTPVELSIVCQDCRQSLGTSQITDSTQVNMSQLNQCIANIKDKEATTSTTSTPTPTTPSTSPTLTTSSPTSSSPTSSSSPTPTTPTSPPTNGENAPTSKLPLILGISGGVLAIIIVVVITIIIMRRKSD